MYYIIQCFIHEETKNLRGILQLNGACPVFWGKDHKELRKKIIKWSEGESTNSHYIHPRFLQYDYDPNVLYDYIKRIKLTIENKFIPDKLPCWLLDKCGNTVKTWSVYKSYPEAR